MIEKHAILSSIEKCRTMRELKQLHGLVITTALSSDVVPVSRLIDFCANSGAGDLSYARALFLRVPRPSPFIWNSIIRSLAAAAHPLAALSLYRDMQRSGSSPNHFTFPFALKATAAATDLAAGESVHCRALKTGFESDVYCSTSLIHMYAACGRVGSARALFDRAQNLNAVGWTTMIAGYVEDDQPEEAISLFGAMESNGFLPNEITVVHLLVACARSRDLETGRWIHSRLRRMETNPASSNFILATALLDMYARCGSFKTARKLFDEMPHRNHVAYNAMISACNQYGRSGEVVELFRAMCASGLDPDNVTLLGLLGACASSGDLTLGQGIHAHVEKTKSREDAAVCTSLMETYAKCGDPDNALRVFRGLKTRDVLAWTSMIIGCSTNGRGLEAVGLFEEMEGDGVVPDSLAFVGVLSACSHAGMIGKGRRLFDSMRRVYGIEPAVEHYGCMVDMLSRAGSLTEAERMVNSMPIEPGVVVWGALLNGCKIHGEVDIAERLVDGDRVLEIDYRSSGVYVMLSNVYAGAGRWEGVERARGLMWDKGVKKTLGVSALLR